MLKQKTKILVVDDDEDIRHCFARILERRGYSVSSAEDGEEALKKIKDDNIQIVLCDIVMPRLNGLDFLKKVREYNLAVETIMITGNSTTQNCVEAIENGACGYLLKPVDTDDIIKMIKRAERNIAEKKAMIRNALGNKKAA